MSDLLHLGANERLYAIDHSESAPPVAIPRGHVGEFVIPGTGKLIWWTGRVAIGLHHRPVRCVDPMAQSALWIQRLLRGKPRGTGAALPYIDASSIAR